MTAVLTAPDSAWSYGEFDVQSCTVDVSPWPYRGERELSVPAWAPRTLRALNRILQVQRATRSAQRTPLDPSVSVSALRVLALIMSDTTPAPAVVPTFDGGLQLEWHQGGTDLELSIEPDGALSAWCEHEDGQFVELDDAGTRRSIGILRRELGSLQKREG